MIIYNQGRDDNMFNWFNNNKGVIILYLIIVTFSLIIVNNSKKEHYENLNKELVVINK